MSVPSRLREKYDLGHVVRIVACECATTSPFTVSLAGGTQAVPAVSISGQSWSTDDTGYALRVEGLPPICFKIT